MLSVQLNYYDWIYENYEILDTAGIPVMVLKPMYGGMLANFGQKAAEIFKSVSNWRQKALIQFLTGPVLIIRLS